MRKEWMLPESPSLDTSIACESSLELEKKRRKPIIVQVGRNAIRFAHVSLKMKIGICDPDFGTPPCRAPLGVMMQLLYVPPNEKKPAMRNV